MLKNKVSCYEFSLGGVKVKLKKKKRKKVEYWFIGIHMPLEKFKSGLQKIRFCQFKMNYYITYHLSNATDVEKLCEREDN